MDSFVFVMLMQKLTNTLYEILKKVIQMLFLKEYFWVRVAQKELFVSLNNVFSKKNSTHNRTGIVTPPSSQHSIFSPSLRQQETETYIYYDM